MNNFDKLKEVEQYLQDLAILHYETGKYAQAKNDHTTAAYHLGKHDAFNIALAAVKNICFKEAMALLLSEVNDILAIYRRAYHDYQ